MSTRTRFLSRFDFPLDPFQLAAMDALDASRSVLVAAPTGAGKTIVGEYAVHLGVEAHQKVFYTAPIKALSNQKYRELVDWLGHERVGLLTGDVSINPEAEVVVMTTEILRNMMYADSPTLHSLASVVMDEVHYLADRLRGPVWEEIIIHLPRSVRIVALSATVSNVEEFGAWIAEVRGDTEVIVSERRPVPLWQHVLVDHELMDVFVGLDGEAVPSHGPSSRSGYREINPALAEVRGGKDERSRAAKGPRERGGRRGYRGRRDQRHDQVMRPRPMSRADVIHLLEKQALLPAIFFIFSRAGCDQAVGQLMRAHVRLTDDAERSRIRTAFRAAFADLSDADADALGLGQIERAAMNGIAAHHAGQLPAVKQVIEQLFSEGLVKVVFATETLALGINMPARTVVLDKLTKYNGVEHADITPGEYTQLTGRAGRRGIDVEGHAVAVVNDAGTARMVAGLASKRSYRLKSAFRPTYNMTVNLLERFTVAEARTTLESSFAQFHTDRSVVSQARKVRELEETVEQYRGALTCEAGDIEEYAEILEAIAEREKALSRERSHRQQDQTATAVGKLRRGDIVAIPGGRRQGFAVVIAHESTVRGPQVTVVTTEGQVRELGARDFTATPMVLDTMRTPSADRLRAAKVRRDTAAALRGRLAGESSAKDTVRERSRSLAPSTAASDAQLLALRERMREHPCHACPERDAHMRWMSRYRKAVRERDRAERAIAQRTSFLGRQFDAVIRVLRELGYLGPTTDDGYAELTDKAHVLQRIYSDRDLIVCGALTDGALTDLGPATLAAVASALSFEPRRESVSPEQIPDRAFARTLHALDVLTDEVNAVERRAGLELSPPPHPGLAAPVYRWARGAGFADALQGEPVAPGDFVRHVRSVVDLLDHIAHLRGSEHQAVAATARKARLQLLRGIIAQDM
ncbi:MAG: DEAD/DEAH box helicase [Dermabacter sp.]|nr:DEAD/DEAH box helicase [Dermabacter sp.]